MEKFDFRSLLNPAFDPYADDYEAGNAQPMRHGGGTPQYAPAQQPSAPAPQPIAGLRGRAQEPTGYRPNPDYVPPGDGFVPPTPARAEPPRRAAAPDNRMPIRYPLISSGADTANDAPDPLITNTPGVGFQRAPYGDVHPDQRPSGVLRRMRDAAYDAPNRAVDAVVNATRSITGPLAEQDRANQQRESARNIPETGGRPATPSTATPRARPAGVGGRRKPTGPLEVSGTRESYGIRPSPRANTPVPDGSISIARPAEHYGIPQPTPAGAGRTIGHIAGDAGLRASNARLIRPEPRTILEDETAVDLGGFTVDDVMNNRHPTLSYVGRQDDRIVLRRRGREATPAPSGAPRDPGVGMPNTLERRRQRRQ